MRENKGFTLIELLAVIVILAIIALIATPVILGIIEESRSAARKNSAKYIISTIETAYASSFMKEATVGQKTYSPGQSKPLSVVVDEFYKDIENISSTKDTKLMSGENVSAYIVESSDGILCKVYSNSGKLNAMCYEAGDVEVTKSENTYSAFTPKKDVTEVAKINNETLSLAE